MIKPQASVSVQKKPVSAMGLLGNWTSLAARSVRPRLGSYMCGASRAQPAPVRSARGAVFPRPLQARSRYALLQGCAWRRCADVHRLSGGHALVPVRTSRRKVGFSPNAREGACGTRSRRCGPRPASGCGSLRLMTSWRSRLIINLQTSIDRTGRH